MGKPRLCSSRGYFIASDLAAMSRWMKDVLSFSVELSSQDPDGPYVDLIRDGLRLKVLRQDCTPRQYVDAFLATGYAFSVQGLQLLRSEFESRDLECTSIQEDGPNRKCFKITDPEGNIWKFWERDRSANTV